MIPFSCIYPSVKNYPYRIPFKFQEEFSAGQDQNISIPIKKRQSRRKDEKKRKKKVEEEKFVVGHWTGEQNKRYHLFLELNSNQFLQSKLRRAQKAFRSMAEFIHSRRPEQCRSHHQKVQKKYGNFLNILRELRLEHYGSLDESYVQNQLESQQISMIGHEILPKQRLIEIKMEHYSEEMIGSSLKVEENEEKVEKMNIQLNHESNFEMKGLLFKRKDE